jgi:hypothetical protein
MWRARPVFVSSTFVDMQSERDHLRTRVFPELEERLRSRHHHLEWVDLRVGVATASQPENLQSLRSLASYYAKIGDVLSAAHRREEALAAYQQNLSIREQIAGRT